MQRLQGRSDVLMTPGVCYHASNSILAELETTQIRLGQTKIKRVATAIVSVIPLIVQSSRLDLTMR